MVSVFGGVHETAIALRSSIMHVLFIHQNFPAQFGHIAAYLIKKKGFRCTFLSEAAPATMEGIEPIQYQVGGELPSRPLLCPHVRECYLAFPCDL